MKTVSFQKAKKFQSVHKNVKDGNLGQKVKNEGLAKIPKSKLPSKSGQNGLEEIEENKDEAENSEKTGKLDNSNGCSEELELRHSSEFRESSTDSLNQSANSEKTNGQKTVKSNNGDFEKSENDNLTEKIDFYNTQPSKHMKNQKKQQFGTKKSLKHFLPLPKPICYKNLEQHEKRQNITKQVSPSKKSVMILQKM